MEDASEKILRSFAFSFGQLGCGPDLDIRHGTAALWKKEGSIYYKASMEARNYLSGAYIRAWGNGVNIAEAIADMIKALVSHKLFDPNWQIEKDLVLFRLDIADDDPSSSQHVYRFKFYVLAKDEEQAVERAKTIDHFWDVEGITKVAEAEYLDCVSRN